MSQELEGTLTNSANLVGTFGSEGGGGTTNYNDLINKPSINSVTLQGNKTALQLGFAEVATSGDYNELTNKPTIPAAQVNSDWNASSGVAEILNKPTLSAVATSGSYDDLTNKPSIPAAQINSDWNATSGVAEILNKPTIPDVSNYYTKSETYNQTEVNNLLSTKADTSSLSTVATTGDYDDLINKPTIPASQVQSDWSQSDNTKVDYIKNKPSSEVKTATDTFTTVNGGLLEECNSRNPCRCSSIARRIHLPQSLRSKPNRLRWKHDIQFR